MPLDEYNKKISNQVGDQGVRRNIAVLVTGLEPGVEQNLRRDE